MNKIIKTLTLLFFVSGISLFVAYSSGCFAVKKELIVYPSFDPNINSQLDSLELSTADEAVIAAEVDSLFHLLYRMSDLEMNGHVIVEYIKIERRLGLLEVIVKQRYSSSIGIIDFYKPYTDRKERDSLALLIVDKDIIQAEIDSLKRHKLMMRGSKSIIASAYIDHRLIDKRLQLLENILKQRQ